MSCGWREPGCAGNLRKGHEPILRAPQLFPQVIGDCAHPLAATGPNSRVTRYTDMSESAAIIKSFFVLFCATLLAPHTLQADGAEDKALPGGNLSADSGAKTRLGPAATLSPSEI